MKYGDTLPLRSVQEWLSYNIDYMEIKQLIKHYTTKKPPVATPDQPTDFEDELFKVFLDQLGRIDLFVKSKAGEIDRRIANCERQITEILRRTPAARAPAKIANRYARIEQEVERAGHDVQSLSRFVNAQRTGFHKLLKKYRKWSGSARLPDRFTILLESPTAFHRHNFDQNVLEVSELLKAVRDGINSLSDAIPTPPCQPVRSSGDKHISYCEPTYSMPQHMGDRSTESRLESDVAFGTSRITTDHSGKATFWVHHDYLIELQVFLLKNLELQPTTPLPSLPPTPLVSRRNSISGVSSGDGVGLVILDNLSTFSDVQKTATVDKISKSSMRTAGQIRWCARDANAFVIVSNKNCAISDKQQPPILEVKIKKKRVETLLDPEAQISKLHDAHQSTDQRHNIEKIRDWFTAHPGVVPLAKVLSRRTRFTGSIAGGEAWAFLDRDVKMLSKSGSPGWLVADDEDEDSGIVEFPHAILEVQWDGSQTPDFIHELTHSHMVESVPGFSLDVHAIATLYEPKDMSPPFWLPALKKDIRKTPNTRPTASRRSSSRIIFSSPSSKTSSTCATGSGLAEHFSTPGTSDGALDARKKRKRKNVKREIKPLSNEWYWNEFDDDDDREEPYTVLVRPSTANSTDDPSEQSLSAFILSPISKLFSRARNNKAHPREYSPLLGEHTEQDSESESEVEDGIRRMMGRYQDYATFGHVGDRQNVYSAKHVGFLVVSFLMLVITGAIAVGESLSGHKNRHKHIGKNIVIDLSVFVGCWFL
ncbi:hypothetical protein BDD12DRAFT_132950 [Trichophaea hybrida]|nr:hypothetical protein BDD12DRAFT_132950 [Trichophaea hybrida]